MKALQESGQLEMTREHWKDWKSERYHVASYRQIPVSERALWDVSIPYWFNMRAVQETWAVGEQTAHRQGGI